MPTQPPTAERPRPAAPDARLVKYDEYIDTQIRNTRRMVKVVDLATVLTVTVLGLLAFLLAAAVVEHWLLPGGFSTAGRVSLFAVLVGSVGYYWYRRLWPLVVRSINPVYAAQAIEQGSPSLKNSLLNLLLFRQRRADITDAVYETLEQQAAERLVRVPVDAAVDRTHLLRLGYVLVAIVAAAVLYKILSPKDPLITAERLLMPWADLVPASRVSIANVIPGNATLARGEVLEVAADVRGIGPDDPVFVRYTTADGQAVDRPVQMQPTAAGLRFVAKLPDAEGRSADDPIGVAQNLRYRIEAVDARSLDYAVTVVAAPTLTVQRIDYEYPDYTGYADRTVDRIGDIRAIEGTRVTIHARANGPIDEAQVDFEADGRRDVRMEVDDTRASGSFVLALRDDRRTPRFTSYVLRYTGTDGRPNRDPVKFSIDVEPDFGPEIALSAPTEILRDVRLDETIAIEVDAIDPDFGLVDVRLLGEAAGKEVFDKRLLNGKYTGRFTGRLQFTPSEYELQAGDVVRYWAVARDSRLPQPNEATSESKSLRIVSADPNQPREPPPDRVAQRDRQQQPGGDQQQPGEQQGNQDGQQQPGGGESAPADGNQEQQDGQQAAGESNDAEGTGENQPGNTDSTSGSDNNQPGNQQQPGAGDSFSRDAERSADPHSDDSNQPQNGEQRERSEDASDSQEQPPVSPEGDNDGEAFERIRKFLQREGELPSESKSDRDANQNAQPNADNANGEPASTGGDQRNPNTDSADTNPADNGRGAETRPDDSNRESAEPQDKGTDPQSPGGQQTNSKGDSGAGEQPQESQGVPDAQPDMKPTDDKWQQKPSNQESTDDQEPPAGGRGKRENDSQGDQGGDATGGGEEGGGQKANREGTGSAGQNQSADEGSGESSEQGSGNTSGSAGRDTSANERTGESGTEEQGDGSSQRDGTGDEPGGEQGEQREGEQAEQGGDQPSEQRGGEPSERSGGEDAPARSEGDEPFSRDAERSANQGDRDSAQGQQQRSDQPTDGDSHTAGSEPGGTPAGRSQPNSADSTAPEGDEANLEYARKQTDLVLEKLADQLKRREVDKRLLDELGWSQEDLARFLERWRELKSTADDNTPEGDAARRELDDALRSLGLRRGPLRQSEVRQDELRDLREGYRGAVPLEYQERLKAYNEGVSRARRNEE